LNYQIIIEDIKLLIQKSITNCISTQEEIYLRKLISSFLLIEKVTNNRNEKLENILYNYYYFVISKDKIWTDSPKINTDNFLFLMSFETYFKSLNILPPSQTKFIHSPFEKLVILSKFWNIELEKSKISIINFLSLFINQYYEIPIALLTQIFSKIQTPWKLALRSIEQINNKTFTLPDILSYFHGKSEKLGFEIIKYPELDRLFSIIHPKFKDYLFIPDKEQFDCYDGAQIVHELQHIQDSHLCMELNLFELEKRALYAEKVFLNYAVSPKHSRSTLLETNLFYPLALLEWELNIILSDISEKNDFNTICLNHGLAPIPLSRLFEFHSPFQMSVYCASAMCIETNWKKYLQNQSNLSTNLSDFKNENTISAVHLNSNVSNDDDDKGIQK
jgi:hypothetical protein